MDLALLVETVLIAGVVLPARWLGLRISLVGADQTAATGMQFSIRQLLFLTFAVACMLAIGKYLVPNFTLPQDVLLVLLLLTVIALFRVAAERSRGPGLPHPGRLPASR